MDIPSPLKWPYDIGTESYQDFIHIKPYEFVSSKRNYNNIQRIPYKPDIYLPIPNSIQFADGISWTTEDFSVVGSNFGKAITGYVTNKGSIESVTSILQETAKSSIPEFALDTLSGIQKLGSREAISQGIGNKILNPYTEQIFKGIGLRSFSFNWKLVPRNEYEQIIIHNIIKYLRYYSTPEATGEGINDLIPKPEEGQATPQPPQEEPLNDRWLIIPKSWKIDFKHNKKGQTDDMKFIPKLKYCVIKDISVNYTPDGYWSTHYYKNEQPAPVAYDLSINFQETEIITNSNIINDGY